MPNPAASRAVVAPFVEAVGPWLRAVVIVAGLCVLATCTAANASSGSGSGPAAAADTASEPATHRTVTVVGDSLTVLGDRAIRSTLDEADWWAALDAFPGRTTGTQMATIHAAASRGNDATVIELGTNDALAIGRGELTFAQAEADIVAALDLFGDRCVVWVIPDRDPERRGVAAGAGIEAIVRREATRRPNLHVADMAAILAAHPGYLAADQVHFTGGGYAALADLMVSTLDACR